LKSLRVLVTDGEQRSALAVVRSLGRANHQVEVTSASGRSISGASRYSGEEHLIPDPLSEPDACGTAILDLVERRRIDVLVPITEASLRVILPLRSRLSGVLLPFADAETFAAVSDKTRILEQARSVGIAVPEQVILKDRSVPAAELPEYPLVLKPYVSVIRDGNRNRKLGVAHAADRTELEDVLHALPDAAFPVMAQRRIVGPGVGIFILRWEGRTIARFAHRRIREKPPSGGVSAYRESITVPETWFEQSELLLNRLHWTGVAMVEYKVEDRSGRPFLMEINGRFWGSLQLAIDAGVDFPRLLLEAASGESKPVPPVYRSGVRLRWEWGDLDHLLARLRRSDATLHLPDRSPSRIVAILRVLLLWRPGERWEVLRPDDPRPFLRESALWLRRR